MDRCVIFILVCAAPVVQCYPTGLVTGSCNDLLPRHSGTNSQTQAAPFTVTTDQTTFTNGQTITVRLLTTGSIQFTGFMLQARQVGGTIPLGSFTSNIVLSQLLTCNGTPDSAVSHTSSVAKTSIAVTWTATSAGPNPIQFTATFVQNFNTYWVGVKSTSLSYSNVSAPTSINSEAVSSGCGVTKLCFSQPLNCDPALSVGCFFMSAHVNSTTNASVQFDMAGPSTGYIAFGFSEDQKMGNDDIYICGLGSNGSVQLQHAHSTGSVTPQIIPLGNVSNLNASVQNGIISCSFTSMNPITTQRTTAFSMPYYLIYAYGPSSNGQILFHTGTFISSTKVDISTPQSAVTQDAIPSILKAHGSLMLIAWMTTGSLGMFFARYLKGASEGHKYCGKDIWFLAHVALMGLTEAATIIAFILIFSNDQGWDGGVHPTLGILVMILSFCQPIVAFFRCAPQHPIRFLFNWAHALNAIAIKGLAGAAIFTGIGFITSNPDSWLMKVMGGFVAWEFIFYILFDLQKRREKEAHNSESESVSLDLLLLGLFLIGNICFLVALLVGIGML